MRILEDRAEQIGISKLILMENAGSELARVIINKYKEDKSKKILIICGSGNNGGDGLVCARHLLGFADSITVCLLNTNKEWKTKEIQINWQIIRKIKKINKIEFFQNKNFSNMFEQELEKCNIVVDAIFGTGLRGNIKQHCQYVITQINKNHNPIISVDIPSGLDPLNGNVSKNIVKAEVTVTFHKVKDGLLNNKDITGEIITVDIGIPPELENNL